MSSIITTTRSDLCRLAESLNLHDRNPTWAKKPTLVSMQRTPCTQRGCPNQRHQQPMLDPTTCAIAAANRWPQQRAAQARPLQARTTATTAKAFPATREAIHEGVTSTLHLPRPMPETLQTVGNVPQAQPMPPPGPTTSIPCIKTMPTA